MPPDAVLETERARFRERQRQEWRHTRARLVRQACPTPTEEAIRAEIEERYAHVSADERAAIARLATAPDGTQAKSEPEGGTEVMAKTDQSGDGWFAVEVAPDGRQRIAMDMVVDESLGRQIARLVVDTWVRGDKSA